MELCTGVLCMCVGGEGEILKVYMYGCVEGGKVEDVCLWGGDGVGTHSQSISSMACTISGIMPSSAHTQ